MVFPAPSVSGTEPKSMELIAQLVNPSWWSQGVRPPEEVHLPEKKLHRNTFGPQMNDMKVQSPCKFRWDIPFICKIDETTRTWYLRVSLPLENAPPVWSAHQRATDNCQNYAWAHLEFAIDWMCWRLHRSLTLNKTRSDKRDVKNHRTLLTSKSQGTIAVQNNTVSENWDLLISTNNFVRLFGTQVVMRITDASCFEIHPPHHSPLQQRLAPRSLITHCNYQTSAASSASSTSSE